MTSRLWPVAAGLAVAAVVLFAWEVAHLPAKGPGLTNGTTGYLGVDYDFHLEAARRWLAGGSPFLPFQSAPYSIPWQGGFLYPPPVMVLLAPFTVLPAVLWWAVPIGLTAEAIRRLRPGPVAAVVMGLLLLLPQVHEPLFYGNPVMWVTAALAWGLVAGWPAVLVLVKPSLAPFALVGIRHRSWWVALGMCLALCLPFGLLWADWITALRNGDGQWWYSARQVPLLLIPLVASIRTMDWE
jgi:hypothetical protein